jgi:carboxylate-amine ligase
MKPRIALPMDGASAASLRATFELAAPSLTLGAEEELMLVRARDGELSSCVETVLERSLGDPRVVSELRSSQIELVTRPAACAADLGRELAAARGALEDALPDDVRPLAVGTHPASVTPGPITDGERYRAIAADHPWAARHMLTCGLHIHVAVAGADRALAVYNALRSYLPELCALAANSPFYHGVDSGLASARTQLNRSLPRAGTPPSFASWDELARYAEWGARGGALPDSSYQWWGLRLHPRHGTLELRIFDTQTEVVDTAALAAFSQALVAWLLDRYDAGERLAVHDRHYVDENLFLASRDASGGWLVDLDTGEREATVDRIENLLDGLSPYAKSLGSMRELNRIAALAWVGGAERQRLFAAENGIDMLVPWLSGSTIQSARQTLEQTVGVSAGADASRARNEAVR